MTTAIYAGSFDPFTLGHLDILKSSAEIFDTVIIAVAYNPEKKGFIPVDDRVELIKKSVISIQNIEVYSFNGLTVEFAKQHNAKILIRGLRDSKDFEYENQLARINSTLNPEIKTVFLTANPQNVAISSTAVKELVSHKCDLTQFVPNPVKDYLMQKFYV